MGLSTPASDGQAEKLFLIGGELHIVFNNSTWTGGEIYRVQDVNVNARLYLSNYNDAPIAVSI